MVTLPERIEQAHRKQLVIDSKRGLKLGLGVHEYRAQRTAAIAHWTTLIRNLMSEEGVSDPAECLPAIIASVIEDITVEARDAATSAARAEVQRILRKVAAA